MNSPKTKASSFYRIVLLILAGESIFILPFVLARIFRPTFLDVFQVNNFQLGTCFSIYGVVALLSYLYGGAIADKFSPRKLIATALFLTAIGGLLMATFPSYLILKWLFGYWGFTTIFLFWGAMIKATRVWGGSANQGRAFGFLEGGRGFVAASIGAIGVFIFALFLPADIQSASLPERQKAFRFVVLFSSFLVAFIGLLVFIFLKDDEEVDTTTQSKRHSFANIKMVMRLPAVWLLMIIVLCAYVGYKLTDIFSLYASEIMLFDEVQAAQVGTFQLYLRPIVCITIGLLADKTKSSLWLKVGFATMLIGAIAFASGGISANLNFLFFLSLIITATGTYAARTLYFAVLHEAKIPLALTGTAVGVVSVIGFTPDIFVGPVMGYFLDRSPGIIGHQQVFVMLAIFALAGFFASFRFSRIVKR
ncbi:sugar phosphate permease [Owenweeksia hongkongensis DSM 17368]|uniref:Sugar phosphate permease n=1 Tax=Owenweeksia hongkongensis (strain DSM 17368 / CIP 108786 / JCM 12287 / NRRL B-23963 / UST20020801) TaxID=926562 RepID=G8R7S1_OWEHD|nr:MFS transporter [Owenweeksia hongkongensis]AEV33452.1 sugar phosphate permease [Owenweeksia hongkongensis DSM 17368]